MFFMLFIVKIKLNTKYRSAALIFVIYVLYMVTLEILNKTIQLYIVYLINFEKKCIENSEYGGVIILNRE